jgi:hypothetical protein
MIALRSKPRQHFLNRCLDVFTCRKKRDAIFGMKTKYYSPQLERELVSILYHKAKAQRIPMTKLANELIKSALARSKYRQIRWRTSRPELGNRSTRSCRD